MKVLGIDPGASGATAYLSKGQIFTCKFTTENDMVQFIRESNADFAILESVHSMPGQGVSSSFKFGANYGFYRGVLLALEIPFETVTPQRWMKEMRCMTKGDKNVTKSHAQELYPKIKMTHAIADACLIATYAARMKSLPSEPDDFLS